MNPRSSFGVRLRREGIIAFAVLTAAGSLAACGGASSSPASVATPGPTASPVTSALQSGSRFTASGSFGYTFTFTLGNDVPGGETATVSVLPTPPPCSGTGCAAVQSQLDGFVVSVAPQPLPADALVDVVVSGSGNSNEIDPILADRSSISFNRYVRLAPAGGVLVVDPARTTQPVTTLAPNHPYAFSVYRTSVAGP
jgi:hypothetical protein